MPDGASELDARGRSGPIVHFLSNSGLMDAGCGKKGIFGVHVPHGGIFPMGGIYQPLCQSLLIGVGIKFSEILISKIVE